MHRCTTFLIPALLLAGSVGAHGQEPGTVTVGPLQVRAGQKVSGFLEVPAGVDEGTRIPVTVARGVRRGPAVAFIAGTHGYEYPPITALQRIREKLEPTQLAGTVILVHVANMPSFLGRTIYYSPVDGKNLNRVYPGRPDGTVSERIAYVITSEVIDRADYVVDLHGGDGNEALRPYCYWMVTGDENLDTASRDMAVAFGLDHIVIDRGRPDDPNASVYTSNTALTRGKPGITTETGRLGSNDAVWVDLAERGVWNLLRHFRMLGGEVERAPAVVWLDHYEVLRSPVTGIFQPAVRDGYAVAEGGLLGVLVDFFGEPLQEVRAPFGGIVNYILGTPPVSEGEPLAMVSRIQVGK
ncbi:MAG: succinylglutamate desuccinylase [Gemmatimonadales bacterium]|nr:succinylglutamate desuccinylase [Gemmatimonadales bacterium]NIN11138.1 succinylglutamate desuccinylase [Gemmatimonadales bacterium]NIN49737.1 succinylglutamate desuccinylase [Gemmatimonadales bacterium]NIP07201.1 succinylglutamate desuccinylase [Gemmatimonadales bacterium]NIR00414.1 succinylglutamate desuccinylase [Gemmatimonadales bacterium]